MSFEENLKSAFGIPTMSVELNTFWNSIKDLTIDELKNKFPQTEQKHKDSDKINNEKTLVNIKIAEHYLNNLITTNNPAEIFCIYNAVPAVAIKNLALKKWIYTFNEEGHLSKLIEIIEDDKVSPENKMAATEKWNYIMLKKLDEVEKYSEDENKIIEELEDIKNKVQSNEYEELARKKQSCYQKRQPLLMQHQNSVIGSVEEKKATEELSLVKRVLDDVNDVINKLVQEENKNYLTKVVNIDKEIENFIDKVESRKNEILK